MTLASSARRRARMSRLVLMGASLLAAPAESGGKGRAIILIHDHTIQRPRPVQQNWAFALVEPLRECATNSTATPATAMVVQFWIKFGPDGKTVSVDAASSENVPPDVLSCARRRARWAATDPPGGSGRRTAQTYLLLPISVADSANPAPRSIPPLLRNDSFPSDPAVYGREVPIVVPLEPKVTDPVARLACELRGRVEACTETVSGYSGTVSVSLIAAPDGRAHDGFAGAIPPESHLTECIRKAIAGSPLPSRPGEPAWRVLLRFAVDEKGVSLVR